jgi:hypothetical protein
MRGIRVQILSDHPLVRAVFMTILAAVGTIGPVGRSSLNQ